MGSPICRDNRMWVEHSCLSIPWIADSKRTGHMWLIEISDLHGELAIFIFTLIGLEIGIK